MVPDPGANLALLEHDVPTDEFAAGDHLHVSGYALLRDSRDAALHALTTAVAAGMTVSVGAASSAPLEQLGADAVPGDAARRRPALRQRARGRGPPGSRRRGNITYTAEANPKITKNISTAFPKYGWRFAAIPTN